MIRRRFQREQFIVNQTYNFINERSFEIKSIDTLIGFNNRRQMHDIF